MGIRNISAYTQSKYNIGYRNGLYVFNFSDGASMACPYAGGSQPWFLWKDIETSEGSFTWTAIDNALAAAQREGRKCIPRVLVNADAAAKCSPDWFFLVTDAQSYYPSSAAQTASHESPVNFDPVFQEKFGATVAALGARYNGHPAIEAWQTVAAGGVYGEVLPGTQNPTGYTNSGWTNAGEFWIDAWKTAFPDTPLMIMVNDIGATVGQDIASYGVQQGYWLQTNSPTPTANTLAILSDHMANTRISIEIENGGLNATGSGFTGVIDTLFSYGIDIDYIVAHVNSFTDRVTNQYMGNTLIPLLRTH